MTGCKGSILTHLDGLPALLVVSHLILHTIEGQLCLYLHTRSATLRAQIQDLSSLVLPGWHVSQAASCMYRGCPARTEGCRRVLTSTSCIADAAALHRDGGLRSAAASACGP